MSFKDNGRTTAQLTNEDELKHEKVYLNFYQENKICVLNTLISSSFQVECTGYFNTVCRRKPKFPTVYRTIYLQKCNFEKVGV